MTPANRTKLDAVGREFIKLSESNNNAQDVALRILRLSETISSVLTDLVWRPEVNSEDEGLPVGRTRVRRKSTRSNTSGV